MEVARTRLAHYDEIPNLQDRPGRRHHLARLQGEARAPADDAEDGDGVEGEEGGVEGAVPEVDRHLLASLSEYGSSGPCLRMAWTDTGNPVLFNESKSTKSAEMGVFAPPSPFFKNV